MQLPATEGNKTQKVLWFISSRTGQQVKRAAVGAEGFVLDHFSKEAIEHHLQSVADPLMAALAEHPPYSVFSDSLEVYGSDWTPNFLTEFKKRRGYDLRPHLPDLFTANPNEEALRGSKGLGKDVDRTSRRQLPETHQCVGRPHTTRSSVRKRTATPRSPFPAMRSSIYRREKDHSGVSFPTRDGLHRLHMYIVVQWFPRRRGPGCIRHRFARRHLI